jgi:hypothetical protein
MVSPFLTFLPVVASTVKKELIAMGAGHEKFMVNQESST